MMKKVSLLWPLLFIFYSFQLLAQEAQIQIEDAWARESPPTVTNGAAYMTLTNEADAMDRLVAASSEVAQVIELHTHTMEGNVMQMRQIDAIEVKPGESTVLEPGGLHIMLIGLNEPLKAGQTFPMTLEFEQAGTIPIEVEVRKMGAHAMPGHGAHQGHGSPEAE